MLKSYNFKIIKDIEYPDHYMYSKKEIVSLVANSKKLNCKIITTEKDFMRIKNEKITEIEYVKSKLEILDEKKLIDAILNFNEIY